jgi:hypothetical protein
MFHPCKSVAEKSLQRESIHSISRYGRYASTVAIAEIAAIFWQKAQHDHQIHKPIAAPVQRPALATAGG